MLILTFYNFWNFLKNENYHFYKVKSTVIKILSFHSPTTPPSKISSLPRWYQKQNEVSLLRKCRVRHFNFFISLNIPKSPNIVLLTLVLHLASWITFDSYWVEWLIIEEQLFSNHSSGRKSSEKSLKYNIENRNVLFEMLW